MVSKRKIKAIVVDIVVFIISLTVLVPFLMVVFNSFKTQTEAAKFTLSLPTTFNFDNYIQVFKTSNIGQAMANGAIYSLISTIAVVFITAAAAFVLQRRKTKASKFVYFLFMVGLVLPMSVIPTIITTKNIGLYGTYINLILLYVAFNIPFCMFMYYNFMGTISTSLDEAVIIDGGNAFQIFNKVIFPLLKPVTVTTFLIVATGIWNDFYYQLYFTRTSKMWAMPMTVYGYFGQYSRDWQLVSANIILALIPILALFIIFQKQIVEGMTVGSVKG